jgi:PAS domain-containing protein
MRRRDKAGGKAIKTQRLKTLKRLKASKIARRRKSIATGKETNVERLTRELAGAVTEQEQLTQELLRREAYLAEAQRLSQTGSWAWSPDQGQTYWSEECYRVLSFDPQDGLPRLEEFFQRIHPDDQPRFREFIQTAIREKAEFEADYRIVHLDGRVRDIQFAAMHGPDPAIVVRDHWPWGSS